MVSKSLAKEIRYFPSLILALLLGGVFFSVSRTHAAPSVPSEALHSPRNAVTTARTSQFSTTVHGGTGRFGPMVHDTFGAGDGRAMALGDLDGDGDLDAVTANYGAVAAAWYNAGDGTYPISITLGYGYGWDVALGDVDGDGDLDAVVAYRGGQVQQVWFNDGRGAFPTWTTFGAGDSRGVALGDLDGDGDLDAVTANNDQPQVVFLNDGSGTFAEHETFGSGDSHDVALGDLDGDGDLDAVVANGGNQAQKVCFNDGSGAFTCSTSFGAGKTQAVALGDVDDDGDLDAVLAGNNGDPQAVWFNDSSGDFIISTTFGAGTSRGLALGDLDADGDLDAVVANYDGEPEEVWFNDGTGSYPISRTFGRDDSWDVVLGDVDADGDLDAVVANGWAGQEVWLNGDAIYVDADAAGANDGSSWADAYVHLQDALDEANTYGGAAACEIWVAEGVYVPDEDSDGDHTDDTRAESFRLNYDGIRLYGGFDGTEDAREARDPKTHVTVLSGDIDGNDVTDAYGVVTDTAHITGTNAHHVLWLDGVTHGPITGDTLIDGFTVTAGYANGSGDQDGGGGLYCDGGDGGVCSPHLARVTFSGNRAWIGGGMLNYAYDGTSSPVLTDAIFSGNQAEAGGGMYNDGYRGTSSPMLVNVTFSGNMAGSDGGGMTNDGSNYITSTSSPVLVNVTFSGNRADWGGGMASDGAWGTSSPVLVNVTLSGNQAAYGGGGMFNAGGNGGTGSPVLNNVIFWGNSAMTGTVMLNDTATPTIAYSLIEGGWDGSGIYNQDGGSVIDGGGNIDADPLFVRDPDPGDGDWTTPDDNDYGDLRLQSTSPAIDAGFNAAITITTDLAGNPRFVDLPTVSDTGSGAPPIVDMGAYERQIYIYLPLLLKNR
jgi:hypothetical protein